MKVQNDNQVITFVGDWVKHSDMWYQVMDVGDQDTILLDEGFWISACADNIQEILSDSEYMEYVTERCMV